MHRRTQSIQSLVPPGVSGIPGGLGTSRSCDVLRAAALSYKPRMWEGLLPIKGMKSPQPQALPRPDHVLTTCAHTACFTITT